MEVYAGQAGPVQWLFCATGYSLHLQARMRQAGSSKVTCVSTGEIWPRMVHRGDVGGSVDTFSTIIFGDTKNGYGTKAGVVRFIRADFVRDVDTWGMGPGDLGVGSECEFDSSLDLRHTKNKPAGWDEAESSEQGAHSLMANWDCCCSAPTWAKVYATEGGPFE